MSFEKAGGPLYRLCLSEETLKVGGPFYLVSMPGEVKDPTQGVTSSGLTNPRKEQLKKPMATMVSNLTDDHYWKKKKNR